MKNKTYKFIISGGGTGGHIYPAIAIAGELQRQHPDSQIVFVGAKGKMEMQLVPEAGFRIHGLWISGIQRKFSLANFVFPLKLITSLIKANIILRRFKPDAVIGVGGFASGPLLYMATRKKIPALIQEQNSYPGITNKLLANRVDKICVAFPELERFFPKEKIVVTGNPVRSDIAEIKISPQEARQHFGLDPDMTTVLIMGGSLGARTINEAIEEGVDELNDAGIQVIWQTGKNYEGNKTVRKGKRLTFIKEMAIAYAASDVVVSRAGALSISELCLVAKPAILIPSPNVAEDHQTKNALALVSEKAALCISDQLASPNLTKAIIHLCQDKEQQNELSSNIVKLGKPHAAEEIVHQLMKLID